MGRSFETMQIFYFPSHLLPLILAFMNGSCQQLLRPCCLPSGGFLFLEFLWLEFCCKEELYLPHHLFIYSIICSSVTYGHLFHSAG